LGAEAMSAGSSVELFTAIVTAVGAAAVVYQVRELKKQITLQNYSEYTRRYSEIVLRFPEDINEDTFILQGREDYNCVMRNMRVFFDLSFEEWDLYDRRLIDCKSWRVWRGGIRTAMGKPAFQQAWRVIERDTRYGESFERFIESSIQPPRSTR
jgi:hypothetical protein